MTQRQPALYKVPALAALLAACIALSACIYRIDIQQGNFLEEDDLALVEVGMTKSQIQFLLGTPMVADPFHQDRWDYPYYRKLGRSRNVTQSWIVVFFEQDSVVRIERDMPLTPNS